MPVKLATEPSHLSSVAFATSGSDVYRLDYSRAIEPILHLSKVYFTDGETDDFVPPSLPLITIISNFNDGLERATTSMIGVWSNSSLSIAQVLPKKKVVPRRLRVGYSKDAEPIGGTPTLAIYSKRLDAMISFCMRSKRIDNRSAGRGFVEIMPMSPSGSESVRQELGRGEIALAICEWEINAEGSTHNRILIGTACPGPDGSRHGRLIFLKVSLDKQGNLNGSIERVKKLDKAIKSILVWDQTRIIVGMDNRVSMYALERTDMTSQYVSFGEIAFVLC
jgi:hypothetical protein